MDDDVWVELEPDAYRSLWAEFAERFQFRAGITASTWPAIREPSPSATWDLSAVFAGTCPDGFAAGSARVAGMVLGTLQDCTQWYESVVFHDWVHPSAMFRPHAVDRPGEITWWDLGILFPNGDYSIFVGSGDRFGIVGHPWEQSLCVFGEQALDAFDRRNDGYLDRVLRRDGRPVLPHSPP